jgi:hypothetical protein
MGAVSAEIKPSLTARWINLRYFYACEVFTRGAYLQRFTPARRAILRILFARFCREMLLSGQMPPPAFAVLLYRAVYFHFSCGLIALFCRAA